MKIKYLKYKEDDHFGNVWLKQNLQKGRDYVIVNQKLWEFFTDRHPNYSTIKRKACIVNG